MNEKRYRCSCGNNNGFEVVRTVRTKVFRHFTLGGEFEDEEPELLLDEESAICIVCNGKAEEVTAKSATTQ